MPDVVTEDLAVRFHELVMSLPVSRGGQNRAILDDLAEGRLEDADERSLTILRGDRSVRVEVPGGVTEDHYRELSPSLDDDEKSLVAWAGLKRLVRPGDWHEWEVAKAKVREWCRNVTEDEGEWLPDLLERDGFAATAERVRRALAADRVTLPSVRVPPAVPGTPAGPGGSTPEALARMERKLDSLLTGYGNLMQASHRPAAEEARPAWYQFQLIGENWLIRFAVNGGVESGVFQNVKGLQHYARLIARQNRVVPSAYLDGRLACDANAQAIAAVLEKFSRQNEFTDEDIRIYFDHIESLDCEIEVARTSGRIDTQQSLFEQRQALLDHLHARDRDSLGDMLRRRKRQLDQKGLNQVMHDTVVRAMSRARDRLRGNGMPRLADFLERTVNPSGHGFVYRPYPPEPVWLL
jgi:hypothetical protein